MSDQTGSDVKDSKDFARRHFAVMQKIAKTIYSPVGLLDSDTRLVLGYDVDTMDTDSESCPPLFYYALLTCHSV